jgi:adenosine deaminase
VIEEPPAPLDDAVFFRTDIGKEYREALPAMGFDADGAKRIARAGFEAAWCEETQKAGYLAALQTEVLALDVLLAPPSTTGHNSEALP